mmetsp:Transcript_23858/g.27823  ORF Transcript_23858/g.27823 Transcript_23858/m.27823 type:complete len:145 (-) Transcript_23858:1695-2129(-)
MDHIGAHPTLERFWAVVSATVSALGSVLLPLSAIVFCSGFSIASVVLLVFLLLFLLGLLFLLLDLFEEFLHALVAIPRHISEAVGGQSTFFALELIARLVATARAVTTEGEIGLTLRCILLVADGRLRVEFEEVDVFEHRRAPT